jgi:hypothetical protein
VPALAVAPDGHETLGMRLVWCGARHAVTPKKQIKAAVETAVRKAIRAASRKLYNLGKEPKRTKRK